MWQGRQGAVQRPPAQHTDTDRVEGERGESDGLGLGCLAWLGLGRLAWLLWLGLWLGLWLWLHTHTSCGWSVAKWVVSSSKVPPALPSPPPHHPHPPPPPRGGRQSLHHRNERRWMSAPGANHEVCCSHEGKVGMWNSTGKTAAQPHR